MSKRVKGDGLPEFAGVMDGELADNEGEYWCRMQIAAEEDEEDPTAWGCKTVTNGKPCYHHYADHRWTKPYDCLVEGCDCKASA